MLAVARLQLGHSNSNYEMYHRALTAVVLVNSETEVPRESELLSTKSTSHRDGHPVVLSIIDCG